MARSTPSLESHLADLEAPQLDLGYDAPEAFLDRLKTQNSALDRLRHELAVEERLVALDDRPGVHF